MAEVVPMDGAVLLIQLERLGHVRPLNVKVTTPLMEPTADGDEWRRKDVVAVLCHIKSVLGEHERKHWLCYRKVKGRWWMIDSTKLAIAEENPFFIQTDECTIDYLVFK